MKAIQGVLLMGMFAACAGCSAEVAKRTTYETLQNIHQRECMQNPSMDCKKRETYEEYQRKRDELDTAK